MKFIQWEVEVENNLQLYWWMSISIEMVKNSYYYGVNMWLSLSSAMSFSTCTCEFFKSAVGKRNL